MIYDSDNLLMKAINMQYSALTPYSGFRTDASRRGHNPCMGSLSEQQPCWPTQQRPLLWPKQHSSVRAAGIGHDSMIGRTTSRILISSLGSQYKQSTGLTARRDDAYFCLPPQQRRPQQAIPHGSLSVKRPACWTMHRLFPCP